MPRAVFEPAIPASQAAQIYALDRAATGIGRRLTYIAIRCKHAGAKLEWYSSNSFLSSSLDGVSSQRHAPAALYHQQRIPVTHWIGGWVGLRAGLDTEATAGLHNLKVHVGQNVNLSENSEITTTAGTLCRPFVSMEH
jgi:hypothetical protein